MGAVAPKKKIIITALIAIIIIIIIIIIITTVITQLWTFCPAGLTTSHSSSDSNNIGCLTLEIKLATLPAESACHQYEIYYCY
jgi:biopolymer transport protein ExbD